MALQTMYVAKNGSPTTTLSAAITAAATTIPLADASVLPPAPGIATIGVSADAELITYSAKDGNTLTGVLRGINGTVASAAEIGTAVFRAYSSYDHDTFIANINALEAGKLATDGKGDDVTVDFAAATTRANVATGEALKTLLGKISKWFADLKGGAFAEIGTASNQVAAGNHTHPTYETEIAEKQDEITATGILKGNGSTVAAAVAGTDYVAPVAGKGLSTNDYTTAEKDKLADLSKPVAATAELTAAGWDASAKTQTVTVSGVTATNSVIVQAAPASRTAWLDAGVYCSAQGAGTLTFTCDDVPESALTANVLIVEVAE